uniref:50S ribosomal protein L18 n=1 Tax=uncultured actinobacterium Rifle_16ft_4_minimus_38826 TaxID=1665148 RepID=A0A0H4TBH8_9ACTN|nr:hypothetical protein [uncultured actinobacterium Rifle_16ft_4_minimus_38826]
MDAKTKRQARVRRHARVRRKVVGSAQRPRLTVWRLFHGRVAALAEGAREKGLQI